MTRGNWENPDLKALSFRHCHYYTVLKKESEECCWSQKLIVRNFKVTFLQHF